MNSLWDIRIFFGSSTERITLYMQSKKIHKVFQWVSLFITYVSSTCFGPNRSIIRSVLYKLYLQIWYVVIRVLLDTSSLYKVAINTMINRFSVMVSYITLKVMSLDPLLFYLQRLVSEVHAMPYSSEAHRISIHEASLIFIISNKATTQNINIISKNTTKMTRLITITWYKVFFIQFVKFSYDQLQNPVIL